MAQNNCEELPATKICIERISGGGFQNIGTLVGMLMAAAVEMIENPNWDEPIS